jgi:TetR/AcrR family transcriptional regulator, transcriptional repressor for nem operon
MRKGELTRQRIVELAAPLFNEKGFAGCSMGDIMEATGLEKGGIYRYFGSKEALAAEALAYSIARIQGVRTADLDQYPTALGKVRRVIARFVEGPSPIPGGCPLMNSAVDADDGNTVLRDLTRQAFADWRNDLAEIVRQGLETGEIRPEVNPMEVADTVVASLEGALVLARLERDRGALKRVQAMLHRLLDTLPAQAPA